MKVLHAGNVFCEKLPGFFSNSYSVLKIKKGRIREKLKIVNGEFIHFADIVKMREVLQTSNISN